MAQKCDVLALGLGIGILLAVYAFLLGLTAWLWNWGTPLVEAVSTLYIGYAPTFLGSIIGAIWAFVDGFIAGVVIAWIYNKFQK
jgi:hypothetical protein|tara:strand:+ start:5911 stop:6162 length:252 start_codon:yes stop_codon:yes gene_type:complete